MHPDLRALFDPRSVAVVGASDDESKWGNWLSTQALRMRHRRRVHLVNRRGAVVHGEPTYRRLADVGGPVDLAVLAVPPAGFDEAVTEALEAGARALIAITAGLAESDAVVARVRAAGASLLGPNCLGALDSSTELYLLANAMPAGSVGMVSQSGNLALELGRRLDAAGMGFSRVASLGNQADLTTADLVHSYVTHDPTELIAVYCEDFARGRDFVDAAAAAVEAGKPVVVLTVGASTASRRGAVSHTGALTTDSSVIDAACEAAGAVRVGTLREMADVLRLLHRFPLASARTTAVISDGGGHAALAADHAEGRGLHVTEFAPALSDELSRHLPPTSSVTNPVDLAGAGEQDLGCFARTLDVVLSSPEVDAAVVTGYYGGFGEYGPRLAAEEVATAREMAATAQRIGKPVVVHSMFPASPAAHALEAGGVPVFDAVEDGLAALALAGKRRTPQPAPLPAPACPVAGDDYWTARELLAGAGVPFPPARLVSTVEDAVDAARDLGFPVVVKALGLVHKSDAGGVALGLRDEGAVRDACHDISARLGPPGLSVETMAAVDGAVELIVGTRQDRRFGTVTMVGLGGVFAETFRDVAFALAPMTATQARALVESLACAPLLYGARGRRPVDVDAVCAVLSRVSRLAAEHPEIGDLEINPVLATPDGALGLDARIVLAAGSS